MKYRWADIHSDQRSMKQRASLLPPANMMPQHVSQWQWTKKCRNTWLVINDILIGAWHMRDKPDRYTRPSTSHYHPHYLFKIWRSTQPRLYKGWKFFSGIGTPERPNFSFQFVGDDSPFTGGPSTLFSSFASFFPIFRSTSTVKISGTY